MFRDDRPLGGLRAPSAGCQRCGAGKLLCEADGRVSCATCGFTVSPPTMPER